MPSSIFGAGNKKSSVFAAVDQLKSLGNPNQAYRQLYMTNPQFRLFADSMQGKSPEQASRENGLDFGQFRNLLR